MKNPHGLPPTRFMKKKDHFCGIKCISNQGPVFGDNNLFITSQYSSGEGSYIFTTNEHGYECDPILQSSLFVNSGKPTEKNYTSLLDYEVYCIANYKDYIYQKCRYPHLIWSLLEGRELCDEVFDTIKDEQGLFQDLNLAHIDDHEIRLKISQLCFNQSISILPNTTLLAKEYEEIIKEWIGDEYKWKLLYRASEHNYLGSAFHNLCDSQKGPMLIIIKSTEGWLFGGYTTQSWSCFNKDMNSDCMCPSSPNNVG